MSERTTIGGVSYESVGSSSSNLLLKCNGTARIQWGNKLIDLIKNGKIASSDSSFKISVITDDSEVGSDGIYILNTDDSLQLLIKIDNECYNLTGADLYISASKKQDITAEQRKQALENIGMYFNTLEEVQNSGIQNGLVYVMEDGNLYTIKNGNIAEFEAKLKTVTVEKENEQGEVINSALKIVLSINGDEYVVLEGDRIIVNKSIYAKNFVQIGSENADKNNGYRLYFDGDTSWLDVDKINVRKGLDLKDYIEVTFEQFNTFINFGTLEPHRWYLITDYLNPWKLSTNTNNPRPILVRALTESTLYKEGKLFQNQSVLINYDPFYKETILQQDGTEVTTKGRITWMKDSNNNEANFDFLDYTYSNGDPITTLHNGSIFPENSYNNKLTIYDLKETVIIEGKIDNTNVNTVDIHANSNMHDNVIVCRGITTTAGCTNLYNNTLHEVCKLQIDSDCINSKLYKVYTTNDSTRITSFTNVKDNNIFLTTQFPSLIKDVVIKEFINSTITNSITNSTFDNISDCAINSLMTEVQFKSLTNCVFNSGTLINIKCYSDINDYSFSQVDNVLLYDSSKPKNLYFKDNVLQIVCEPEQVFLRGMIVMHSGITPIPDGWAPCDGNEYTFNGVTSKTPNLVNKFIKAVASANDVKESLNEALNDKNELLLKKEHLPKHQHQIDVTKLPQYTTDEITGNTARYDPQSQFVTTSSGTMSVGVSVSVSVSVAVGDASDSDTSSDSDSDSITLDGTTINYLGSGDKYESIAHYHKINWGTELITEENDKDVEQISIKIEPQSYYLLFIMKL
jgi:hypothetical protein